MPDNAEFTKMIASTYQRLYDLVRLRTDPLVQLLVSEPDLTPKERGWRLHQLLLSSVEELNPGTGAPAFSRVWRRYRLMYLRYIEGLDPQVVADQLAISRRQYYREHAEALEMISEMLWNRYLANKPLDKLGDSNHSEQDISHLELMRLEVARVGQSNHVTNLKEVVQEGLSLIQEICLQNRIETQMTTSESRAVVVVERGLFRQMLLAMMGFLIERAQGTCLHITIEADELAVQLTLSLDAVDSEVFVHEVGKQLLVLEEFATLTNTQFSPIKRDQIIIGFRIRLPRKQQQTILVIDDNEDMLALYERYLLPHQYNVISTVFSRQGYELACQYAPAAIILDLMMAEVDGWDLLQKLIAEPKTETIPIIVCSVLKQKQLALSLGARAFLEKPITEETLLAALHDLKQIDSE